jgi:hypothetical protein
MRLVDADELLKEKTEIYIPPEDPEETWCFEASIEVIHVEDVNKALTIDAVPVVRCGECALRNKAADLAHTIYCPWLGQQMRKSDFCSRGER